MIYVYEFIVTWVVLFVVHAPIVAKRFAPDAFPYPQMWIRVLLGTGLAAIYALLAVIGMAITNLLVR